MTLGIFLDRWAGYATALGWGPLDLPGCDRDRLLDHIDEAGLLWRLKRCQARRPQREHGDC
jgi:hypothetical protein